jgi:hypothetical protein
MSRLFLSRNIMRTETAGQDARAQADVQRLRRLRPTDPWPLLRLGRCHTVHATDGQRGQAAEAVKAQLGAQELQPHAVRARPYCENMGAVRRDRAYRPMQVPWYDGYSRGTARSCYPSAHEILDGGSLESGARDSPKRKVYNWGFVDVSDLVEEQNRIRSVLLAAADSSAPQIAERDMKALLRSMHAINMPKALVRQVHNICADGEVSEVERDVLKALIPPSLEEQLQELVGALSEPDMERMMLALFRHYCYLSVAGTVRRRGPQRPPHGAVHAVDAVTAVCLPVRRPCVSRA